MLYPVVDVDAAVVDINVVVVAAEVDVEVDAAAGSLKTSMPLFYTDLVKSSLNVYS